MFSNSFTHQKQRTTVTGWCVSFEKFLPLSSRSHRARREREGGSVLLCTLAALLTCIASAQTYTPLVDSLWLQDLQEVEVVAQRYHDVIPGQRLSADKLEALNALSVADAMRYFSGAQIKDYGGVGGIKTVDVRSMGSNHLGVFYDGIEIGNAQNGVVDLGKFSLDNLDAVELYNGQKSDIFQAAKDFGASGTLYLKTRRPHFIDGKNHNIQITLRGGSFGLINPSVLYEQKLSPKVSLSANAEYTHATGRYRFRAHQNQWNALGQLVGRWDTTGIRQNGDINAVRAEAGVFGYTDDGKWHAKAYYYQSQRGIPKAIVRNVWTSEQRQWDRNFFLQGSYQKRIRNYDFQLNAKYSLDYMRYLNPDTTLMYLDNHFRQQELYLSTANRYQLFPCWQVNLSADYQLNWLDANLRDFVCPVRNSVMVAAATALDIPHFQAQASLLYTFVHDHTTRGTHTTTRRHDRWTPALYLSYKPWLKIPFTIRAFYKRSYRMPTFNDLYYTDVGNLDLRPEDAQQFDFGLAYRLNQDNHWLSALELHADGYYNRVRDKILAIPKGNSQYRWQMLNLGLVNIAGLDASADATFRLPADIRLRLALKYTYQRAMDYSDPTDQLTYRGQIAYIPRHSGSVCGTLTWRTWGLNYSFIYVGERYHQSANIPANYEPAWYTHDLSLAKDFHFTKSYPWHLRLMLEVNNIFNQQYDVILNYPMPGTNLRATLRLTL